MRTSRSPFRQAALITLAILVLLVALQVKFSQEQYQESLAQFQAWQFTYEEQALRDTTARLARSLTRLKSQTTDTEEAVTLYLQEVTATAQETTGRELWVDQVSLDENGRMVLQHLLVPQSSMQTQVHWSTEDLEGFGVSIAQQQQVINEGEGFFITHVPYSEDPEATQWVSVAYDSQTGLVTLAVTRSGYLQPAAARQLDQQRRQLQIQLLWVSLVAVLGYGLLLLILRRAKAGEARRRQEEERRLAEKERELSQATNKVEQAYASLMNSGVLDQNIMHNHASLSNWLDANFELFTRKSSEAILSGQVATALVLIELDDLLEIGQRHGLEAGDAALSLLAEALEQHTRKSDIVARWLEGSFLLVMNDISLKNALGRVEDLRAGIQAQELEFGNQRCTVTVTCGLSMMLDTDKSWKQALTRAQRALTRGREANKNTVCHEIFQ